MRVTSLNCVAVQELPPTASQNVPGIENLHKDTWSHILSASRMLRCAPGTELSHCDLTAGKFVVVLGGVIRVYQAGECGRELSLYRVHTGHACMLALTRLLDHADQCARAVTEQETLLLAMPADGFFQLIKESGDFSHYLVNAMANCISEISKLLCQVSFNRLDQRLADLILRVSDHTDAGKIRLTHQAIADELGATREVVSRLLKDFENAGHVRLGRGSIEISARDRLLELSERC